LNRDERRERKRENFRAVFGRQVRLVENLRVLRVKKCHFFRGNKLKIVTSVPDRFFVAINADSMPPLGCHEAARCGILLYVGSYVHPSIGLGGLHRHRKCNCHCFLMSGAMYTQVYIDLGGLHRHPKCYCHRFFRLITELVNGFNYDKLTTHTLLIQHSDIFSGFDS
jgi:hypothetical protein